MDIETDVNSLSDGILDKDGILGHQVFLVLSENKFVAHVTSRAQVTILSCFRELRPLG